MIGVVAGEEAVEMATKWIGKLCVKNGAYPPDSYPNPALAYHNAQLEASAFSEEFDAEGFEDSTLPKVDMIHKVRTWLSTHSLWPVLIALAYSVRVHCFLHGRKRSRRTRLRNRSSMCPRKRGQRGRLRPACVYLVMQAWVELMPYCRI